MLKTTGSSERSTSKELGVGDGEVVGFGIGDGEVVGFGIGGGDGSLNRKIVLVQSARACFYLFKANLY